MLETDDVFHGRADTSLYITAVVDHYIVMLPKSYWNGNRI